MACIMTGPQLDEVTGREIIIKTHPGCFHADDVFGVVVLMEVARRAGATVRVIRTRDPEVPADFHVDVGMGYDPASGCFDHHQEAGAGYRNTVSGEPYAAFGLVWREFGATLCEGNQRAANLVDYRLVRHVDAVDCGIATGAGYSISNAISSFNPCWDEGGYDQAFSQACEFASGLLDREIRRGLSAVKSERKVQRAITKSRRRGIRRDVIVFERFLPWKSVVANNHPEVGAVVFPDESNEWVVHAAPMKGSSRDKLLMPESWGGLSNEALDKATGIPGGVFCHKNRFMAVHKTQEGAIEMAFKAIGPQEFS